LQIFFATISVATASTFATISLQSLERLNGQEYGGAGLAIRLRDLWCDLYFRGIDRNQAALVGLGLVAAGLMGWRDISMISAGPVIGATAPGQLVYYRLSRPG
jgi:hypothetical protein